MCLVAYREEILFFLTTNALQTAFTPNGYLTFSTPNASFIACNIYFVTLLSEPWKQLTVASYRNMCDILFYISPHYILYFFMYCVALKRFLLLLHLLLLLLLLVLFCLFWMSAPLSLSLNFAQWKSSHFSWIIHDKSSSRSHEQACTQVSLKYAAWDSCQVSKYESAWIHNDGFELTYRK